MLAVLLKLAKNVRFGNLNADFFEVEGLTFLKWIPKK